jgi:hypothetical protein
VGKSNVRIAIPGKACYLQLAKHLIGERHSHTLSALQRRAVVQQVPGHESDLQQLRLAVYTLGRCHSRLAARRAVRDGLHTCLSSATCAEENFTGSREKKAGSAFVSVQRSQTLRQTDP